MKPKKLVQRETWNKIRKDQVLNLSELSIACGYPRGVLAKLSLPLIAGKISLSDFKRIIRRRQNSLEGDLNKNAKPNFSDFDTATPSQSPLADKLFYGQAKK